MKTPSTDLDREPTFELSVVVPFYDEVHFVDTAIRSITGQGITSCEVVIVNDQPEAFDQAFFDAFGFPENVRVVHHDQNRGLSAARNTGIAACSGAFIAFLDADDYYVTGGLQRQFEFARLSDADITHAQAYRSPQGTPEVETLRRDALLYGERRSGTGLESVEEAQFFTSSWSSIYKASFLEDSGVQFDVDQRKFEDRLFVVESVTAARSIAQLGEPVRVWRGRAGSISVTATDPDIRRLQLQLLEKCMGHVRKLHARGALPYRFVKREIFNTVSRLIWDIDLIEAIVSGEDPEPEALAARIPELLGADSFGHQIFEDPVIQPISRVGMQTRKGRITRVDFYELHKLLRDGRFEDFCALRDTRTAELKKQSRPAAPRIVKSSKPRRLVLHVGLHKTGTTYLQRQMQAHRKTLAARGILVPRTGEGFGPGGGVRQEGYPGHLGLFRAARHDNTALRDAFYLEVERSDCTDVLVSCENMLAPMAQDRDEQLEKLFDFFAPFAERQVIGMVRRPDRWFDAFYREIAVNGMRSAARPIAEFAVDYEQVLFDLPSLLGPFETFARQKVALADYDVAKAGPGIWPGFLDLAGLADRVGDACPAQATEVYPSRSREEIQAAQIVNALIPDSTHRQDILTAFFAQPGSGASGSMPFLSPADRLRQMDLFEELAGDFAMDRGYSPALTEWRRQLSVEDWSPPRGVCSDTMAGLVQAGFYSERPATRRRPIDPQSLTPARVRIKDGAMVFRVYPRPWLRKAARWASSLELPRFGAGTSGPALREKAPAKVRESAPRGT